MTSPNDLFASSPAGTFNDDDEDVMGSFEEMMDQNEAHTRPGFLASLGVASYGRNKSSREKEEERLAGIIRDAKLTRSAHGQPVFYVPVWSQKGGVGKTTLTTGLAHTIARNYAADILFADINPDGGSAAVKLGQTTPRTILDLRDVIRDPARASRLNASNLTEFFNQHPTRLKSIVLPPGKKASREDELTARDFYMIAKCVEALMPFKIMFIDCGTNPSSSVMSAVRHMADQMIIVTSTNPDEASVASGGLASLRASKFGYLVDNAITVVIDKQDPKSVAKAEIERRPGESRAENKARVKELRERHKRDAEKIWAFFEENTAQILHVPYDPIVGLTSQLNIDDIAPATRLALLEVGAAVVERLSAQANLRTQ